jgi:1-acyl-sn-glycerol-3-phosphate acyltransferase
MNAIDHRALRTDQLAGLSRAAVDPGHALIAPLFQAFCGLFLKRLGSLTVEAAAALPGRPFMVCANHSSHVDSAVLMAASGLPFQRCGLLAAEDYFFCQPVRLRVVSSVLRLIPVERRPTAEGLAATIEGCRRFLQTGGQMLVAYPEGTRSMNGRIAPFKRGPVTVALTFDLPIVPAYISGTDRVLPKGRSVPVPAAVTVRFGAALNVRPGEGASSLRARSKNLTEQLEERIRSLAVHGR